MSDICSSAIVQVICGDAATNLANTLFVDPNGDDATAAKGNLHKPWATMTAAQQLKSISLLCL